MHADGRRSVGVNIGVYLRASAVHSGPSLLAWCVAAALVLGACSSLKVPATFPRFPSERLLRTQSEGVNLEAYPLEGHETYWEVFDEDLPRAGIAAVWVKFVSAREDALDLKGLQIKLRAGARDLSPLAAHEVLEQYYRGRGIRAYGVLAHEKSRQEIGALILKPRTLAPNGSVEGFLFFKIDPDRSKTWTRGTSLVVEKIRLSNGKQIQIVRPLSDANL